jgi:hypothetical protein
LWLNNSLNHHLAKAALGISGVVVEQRRRGFTQQLRPPSKAEHLLCFEQSFLNTQLIEKEKQSVLCRDCSLQSCQSFCRSELIVPYPTTALVSLVNHRCYYAFEDLLLVYSTYLVAPYDMTHRDSKSLSTSFLRLCFPLISPLASVNKMCAVIPVSSRDGTRACIKIS